MGNTMGEGHTREILANIFSRGGRGSGLILKGSGSEREHGSGSEIELDPGSENGIKTGFEFRLRGFKVIQDPE